MAKQTVSNEKEALGILFGVLGGSKVSGESGRLIKQQLMDLVKDINASGNMPKIKLQVALGNSLNKLESLKKKLEKIYQLSNIKITTQQNSAPASPTAQPAPAPQSKNTSANSSFTQRKQDIKKLLSLLKELYKAEQQGVVLQTSKNQQASSQYQARSKAMDTLIQQYNQLGLVIRKIPDQNDSFIDDAAGQDVALQTQYAQQENMTLEERTKLIELLEASMRDYYLATERMSVSAQDKWSKEAAKANDYIKRLKDVGATRVPDVADLIYKIDQVASTGGAESLEKLKTLMQQLGAEVRKTGADVETWGHKMAKSLTGHMRTVIASFLTAQVTKALRSILTNVIALDKAVVDLQIASGKNREETKALVREYSKLGKEIAATTAEVAASADTWLRQGYEISETQKLIANSTMLSKLGQMESAEAAKALTSTMKGYNRSVDESISIVDKLTAVDMEAAVSAGGIATAMAETATSARLAGVDMDTLIGYIATVSEVTQDGAESVGTFYKTMFARMNNVKAGQFVDSETGESLNDVEKVLGELEISLRDTNGLFRDTDEVLAEVGSRWDRFNNVQQHAIATAIAGTRQQEKFIVLMDNYAKAQEYASTATNSAGTATEKYGAYLESVDGKMATLKATYEEFSLSVLNSDWVVMGIQAMTSFVEVLNSIAQFGDGAVIAILAIAAALAVAQAGFIAARAKIHELSLSYYKMAIAQGVATVQTNSHTAALLYFTSTGLLGVITTIPRFIIALGKYVLSLKAGTGATTTLSAAMQSLNVNPVMLVISAIVAAGALAIGIAKKVDKAWKDSCDQAAKNAEKQADLVDQYASEIGALEALRKKLVDAHGSKQKLASIYDELNKKVAMSSGFLKGEESAYRAVVAQIEDQIEAKKKLREEAAKEALSAYRVAFNTRRGVKYNSAGIDWLAADANGETMRQYARNNGQPGYGMLSPSNLNKLDAEAQKTIIELYGFTVDSWTDYWKAQVDTAKIVFRGIISDTDSSLFDDVFMESAVESLIQGGYDLDETYDVLQDLLHSEDLEEKLGEYHEAGQNGDLQSVDRLYNEITETLNTYASKYPELEKMINTVAGSIRTYDDSNNALIVTKQELTDVLDSVGGAYDALSKAMEEMSSHGALSAETITTITEEFPELLDYLTETADGFIIADDAISNFFENRRSMRLADLEKAKNQYANALNNYKEKGDIESYEQLLLAEEQLNNAIVNAQNEYRSESILTRASLLDEYAESLESRIDGLNEEIDAYDAMCEARKELLQTYQDELDYREKLNKAKSNVSDLSAKAAIASLDTSAAGQARLRELQSELSDAKAELEDITLERAIELLETDIDDSAEQHRAFLQKQIQSIETEIQNASTYTVSELKTVLGKPNGQNDKTSDDSYLGAINGASGVIDDTLLPPRWKSYEDATDSDYGVAENAGGVMTKNEFARYNNGGYESYQAYLDALYEKTYGMAPKYHTGGFVGDISTLHSNEQFAKLLKGEFVSTPAQMQRFMNQTLPGLVSSTSRNEFNAPLISIECGSVTPDSIPDLERIVKTAVQEVKKQLDDGMSRTGFKGSRRRMPI